jgi:hypothetical protein
MTNIRNILYICILLCAFSCASKHEESPYEKMKAEKFDQLIKQLGDNPTNLDTIYTEMYIALQVAEEDSTAHQLVIDKATLLLAQDTIMENRIHYLEAMCIIYSMDKNYDKYWETFLRQLDCYPTESLERLTSYALYHAMKNNKDSMLIYSDKAIAIAKPLEISTDPDSRINGYITICSMLVAQGNDVEAKAYIDNKIKEETNQDNLETLTEMSNNFDSFKKEIIGQFKSPSGLTPQ